MESPPRLRRVEILAALSLATDLAMGQTMEHGLRTCLLAERLAGSLGLDEVARHDVYELALLRWIGCTAHAHELAVWFDDEIDAHRRSAQLDFGRSVEVMADMIGHAGAGRGGFERLRTVVGALLGGKEAVAGLFSSSCEVAGRLAPRLGVGSTVQAALAHVFARWDGRGWPRGVGGDDIALSARIVHVAQDAAVAHRLGGVSAARSFVARRAGSAHDPAVSDAFVAAAEPLLNVMEQPSLWTAVLDSEPGHRTWLTGRGLDDAFEAVADFSDLKSPWTAGHSRAVAVLVAAAAPDAGIASEKASDARRAALVHDLGRAGIPNGIWDRPGPLSDGAWEQVRLHPYFTERILCRSPVLAPLGAVASGHHERLDGSGYHRGGRGPMLDQATRTLAVADAYQAMISPRPHRDPLEPGVAAAELRTEAGRGRLDAVAVGAVLDATGHRGGRPRNFRPAGLSPRESEVLALAAQGASNKSVAATLGISAKTVSHHLEHAYTKIGVRSRAAAVLYAVEHGLV